MGDTRVKVKRGALGKWGREKIIKRENTSNRVIDGGSGRKLQFSFEKTFKPLRSLIFILPLLSIQPVKWSGVRWTWVRILAQRYFSGVVCAQIFLVKGGEVLI